MLYAELVGLIEDWLARGDLSGRITSFIDLGQEYVNGRLYIRQNLKKSSFTITNSNPHSPPSDLLKIISVEAVGSSNKRSLPSVTWQMFSQLPQATGFPAVFALCEDGIYIWPLPSTSMQGQITYYAMFPKANYQQSNWVLETEPRLYLYAALVQAEPYLFNDPRVVMWKQLLDEAIQDVNQRYAVGPMT